MDHDRTSHPPEPWKSWLGSGESSPNGQTIQGSEILFHLPRCMDVYGDILETPGMFNLGGVFLMGRYNLPTGYLT